MKKLMALFTTVAIIASCACVNVSAAEIESLAGGPYNFENDSIEPFTNAKAVDSTNAGVDFVSANGGKVISFTADDDMKFSEAGITKGIIEFTTDWYSCNTKNGTAGYGVGIGIGSAESDKYLSLLKITKNKEGIFASACSGWSIRTMNVGQWMNLKIIVNVDSSDSAENGYNSWYEVYYKASGADDSTYKKMQLQYVDLESATVPAQQVSYGERFVFDEKVNASGNNNNQKMLSNVNRITIKDTQKTDNCLFDNMSVKVYEPLFEAVSKCKTADEVKAQLKLYHKLAAFDYGSEYTKTNDMNAVFSALANRSFASDAEVINAYNAAVSANLNPYISERYIMDDLTEKNIFPSGSLIYDENIKTDGNFYKPDYDNRATGVNFTSPITEGIIKFKSDVYVNYDSSSRITPFSVRVAANDNVYSQAEGTTLANINRSGSFAVASAAWTPNATVQNNKWSNIEYLLDVEDKSLRIKSDGKDATMPWSYNDYKVNTVANSNVYKFTGETGSHEMKSLPSSIYGIRVCTEANGGQSLDYLANTDITLYKPLYKAVNEAQSAQELANVIDFYSGELKVFAKSDKSYSDDEIYAALGGKTYASSKEFEKAYEEFVLANELNKGLVSLSSGIPTYINAEINTADLKVNKDDVSYIALYDESNALLGVYELPRLTYEKNTGDGYRVYTHGEAITFVNWDINVAAASRPDPIISASDWNAAKSAKAFIWSKDSQDNVIIPITNAVKVK